MKKAKHKITFSNPVDARTGALAKWGIGNAGIRRDDQVRQSRTDHQINYRLAKLQKLEGKKGGYRRAWGNGLSDTFRKHALEMVALTALEIQRQIPQKLAHPTPKTRK